MTEEYWCRAVLLHADPTWTVHLMRRVGVFHPHLVYDFDTPNPYCESAADAMQHALNWLYRQGVTKDHGYYEEAEKFPRMRILTKGGAVFSLPYRVEGT